MNLSVQTLNFSPVVACMSKRNGSYINQKQIKKYSSSKNPVAFQHLMPFYKSEIKFNSKSQEFTLSTYIPQKMESCVCYTINSNGGGKKQTCWRDEETYRAGTFSNLYKKIKEEYEKNNNLSEETIRSFINDFDKAAKTKSAEELFGKMNFDLESKKIVLSIDVSQEAKAYQSYVINSDGSGTRQTCWMKEIYRAGTFSEMYKKYEQQHQESVNQTNEFLRTFIDEFNKYASQQGALECVSSVSEVDNIN